MPGRSKSYRVYRTAIALCALGLASALAAGPTLAEDTKLLKAPVSPVPPHFDSAAIDKATAALDGIVETAMKRTGLPGLAVGVVYKDKVCLLYTSPSPRD